MSLFGLLFAAGTPLGEALLEQRERERVQREGRSFYVPADLSALGVPGARDKQERKH